MDGQYADVPGENQGQKRKLEENDKYDSNVADPKIPKTQLEIKPSCSASYSEAASERLPLKYGSVDNYGIPKLSPEVANRAIFVRNLSRSVTEEQLKNHFKSAEDVILPLRNDKNRGYAFIIFANEKLAEEGIGMRLTLLNGKHLICKPANVRKGKPKTVIKTNILLIKRISINTTEGKLWQLFDTAKHIHVNGQRFQKKHAFIEYENVADAEHALMAMDGEMIDGEETELNYWRHCHRRSKGRGRPHQRKHRKRR